jgi:hypothetical protein
VHDSLKYKEHDFTVYSINETLNGMGNIVGAFSLGIVRPVY